MTRFLLILISRSLELLSLVIPKTAGRFAYRLFCRPRGRRSVPSTVEGVMARAERLTLSVSLPRWGRAGTTPQDSETLQIAAYRWPATQEGGRRALLVHGWESRAARLAVWVEPLLAAGFEVVAFDGPAHGDSEGTSTNPTEFVRAMGVLVERVGQPDVVVGHSLGGLSTMIAVSGHEMFGGFRLEPERLVVVAGGNSGVDAMSMFCSALGLKQGFLPLILSAAQEASGGYRVADFDGDLLFSQVPIPTLWMHDPEDDVVPFRAAQRVDEACDHVELVSLSGLGHHKIARDPSVIRRGLDFLESA